MRTNRLTNILLSVIAAALIVLAARQHLDPPPVTAQSISTHPLYFEPGVHMLRAPDGSKQVYGRVVVDLQTGKIWGFPTVTSDTYPFNPINRNPETSHPFELGRFALEDIGK